MTKLSLEKIRILLTAGMVAFLLSLSPTVYAADEVAIDVEVGDGLAYNVKTIEVAAGSKVKLTITHKGKLPKAAMGHNWVLLAKDADRNKFMSAAMTAQKTNYIPEKMKGQVLAHTKIVGGGESDTIEFTAPEAGEYVFLCSFPGHGGVMNGKLLVK
ncbi:MAG: azurin [Myxococcota bacterium]